MSQDKDEIKNNNSITDNTVPNVENNSLVDKTKTENINQEINQNVTNNCVNENIPQDIIPSNPSIRKDVVLKAINFLIAKPVQNSNIDRKVNFLRLKGLTDQEIQLSLEKAIMYLNDKKHLNIQNNDLSTPFNCNFSSTVDNVQLPSMSQNWFKRFFGPIVMAATIVYIGNNLYKKYIKKWLFGVLKSPLEIRLEAVEHSLERCIILLEKINNTSELSNSHIDQQKERDPIRAELKSIKSLLLNRFQFPPASASSSIPQWQLIKNPKVEGEQQNKINSTDASKSPQNGINIETNNLIFGYHATGLADSDIVKDSDNLVSNLLLTKNSNDEIVQMNGD